MLVTPLVVQIEELTPIPLFWLSPSAHTDQQPGWSEGRLSIPSFIPIGQLPAHWWTNGPSFMGLLEGSFSRLLAHRVTFLWGQLMQELRGKVYIDFLHVSKSLLIKHLFPLPHSTLFSHNEFVSVSHLVSSSYSAGHFNIIWNTPLLPLEQQQKKTFLK